MVMMYTTGQITNGSLLNSPDWYWYRIDKKGEVQSVALIDEIPEHPILYSTYWYILHLYDKKHKTFYRFRYSEKEEFNVAVKTAYDLYYNVSKDIKTIADFINV